MRLNINEETLRNTLQGTDFTYDGYYIWYEGKELFRVYPSNNVLIYNYGYAGISDSYIYTYLNNERHLDITLQEMGIRPHRGLLVDKDRYLTPLGYRKYKEEAAHLTPTEQVSWAYKTLRKRSFFVTTWDGKFIPKCMATDARVDNAIVYVSIENRNELFGSLVAYGGAYWSNHNISHEVNGYIVPLSVIIAAYQECDECGLIHSESMCPHCSAKYKIHSYSTRAEHSLPFKDEGEVKPEYIGIELEYDNCTPLAMDVYKALDKHVILKRDGSVHNGFEIVTAPATLASHKKAFKGFYDQVKGLGAEKNCGMHVHVDKRAMGQMQIGKMLAFLYARDNIANITALAGRSFATNSYCKAEAEQKVTSGISGTEYGVERRSAGKYQALNTSPTHTIEIRIFAPPKDERELFSRLEFVQALVDWTKPAICSVKDAVSWEKFKEFVWKYKKSYPNLIGVI
jgi:hypothetical protein